LTSQRACQDILGKLLQKPNPTRKDVANLKVEFARIYRLKSLPSNAEILEEAEGIDKEDVLGVLKRKAVRTISGVAVIAVMTAPYPCPHGRCAYCPGGVEFDIPQSYTGFEPATMRGRQNEFDAYRQVRSRITQLEKIGHEVDKVELIVMGGNFTSTPNSYQRTFLKRCLEGMTEKHSGSLEEAKKLAELSKIRNVGITVETRPDWAKEPQIDRMLGMGVTRVELGVQTIYDDVYMRLGRSHYVADVVKSTRLLKDAGLKVCYHMMPGLPSVDRKQDMEAFRRIFSKPEFRPDMIKVYPTLVLEGTKVYGWWVQGRYEPPSTDQMVDLLTEVKKIIPPWIRIMRIQRDIPAPLIVAGVKKSNLRELVRDKLRQEDIRCRCIRCREVGHRTLRDRVTPSLENLKLLRREYDASGGKEFFLSIEDEVNDAMIGYLRLRIPSKDTYRPEIVKGETSLVRELHVCGPLVSVGERSQEAWQHRGYGRVLLSEAENISKGEYDLKKLLVTSALGTKEYYMRLGYAREGVYMSKMLED